MEPRRSSDVLSVVALVAGFVVALGLVFTAFAVSLCGLFGEQCTTAEERQIDLLMAAALGVFLGVPALVAYARRQARWLLAPVLEGALLTTIVFVVAAF